MSLYQCQHCGCVENTALAMQPRMPIQWFDWTGIEDRSGDHLCSACGPTKYRDGTATGMGQWHGEFDRVFLPMDMFVTNREGNLAHRETGDTDFRKYAIEPGADSGSENV